MKRLVLHHRYSTGLPWDVSGFGNHGIARLVQPNSGALRFKHAGSRIDVPPSGTLYELGAFRASVTFRLDPHAQTRRNNLIEGHLTFALFAAPGGKLQTTILDQNGDWRGASASGLPLFDGQWHRADCGHDGVSTSWVALDGKVVHVRQDVPGPGRPLGPNGVSIGHWPEPSDGGYTLDGDVSHVWLWHHRPDPPDRDCCTNFQKVATVERALRERGFDRRKLADFRQAIQKITAKVHGQLSPSAAAAAPALGAQLHSALAGRRWTELGHLAAKARQLVKDGAGSAVQQDAAHALRELVAPLLSDRRILNSLDATLCQPETADEEERPPRGGDPLTESVDEDNPQPGYPPADRPPDDEGKPRQPRKRGPRKRDEPKGKEQS
ncbi:hypothetical protein [Sphingomonas sp.]|uniref:hypothetical protein n=1 Tax=Sphingomonas sp. TaxID=28214 RepID=UPI001828A1E5|nr:hypothetical protein [Sphingomonas sp.]MBA3512317.1 hypothetical protein [Sphingomonas sp.]